MNAAEPKRRVEVTTMPDGWVEIAVLNRHPTEGWQVKAVRLSPEEFASVKEDLEEI